jgi:membrane-associated phospholipid phosphatase
MSDPLRMVDAARFSWLGGAKAAVLCGALRSASVHAADEQRRAGDFLATALPISVVAHEAWRRDGQGLWQFGLSYGVTVAASEVLKRTTHSQRPDRSNDLSFPSGHASQAFAAATSSWLFVDPNAPPNVVVLGSLGRGSVALELHATW